MRADQTEIDFRGKYRLCIAGAVCIAGACFSLMGAPLVNYSKEDGSIVSGIVLSIVTWCLVLGSVFLMRNLRLFASYWGRRDRSGTGERYRRAGPGIVTLAANPEGLAAEIVALAGVTLWILRALGVVHFEGPMRMLQYSMTFSGFLLHCFFNGKNYLYIKQKAKREQKRGTHE